MKKSKPILIGLIILITISNIPIITPIFTLFLDERHYRYSNFDGSCTHYEFKSNDFEVMKRLNEIYFKDFPNKKDQKLYRLFSKNPLAFWRWRLYFVDERYKLPYRDFDEILKLRGPNWQKDELHQFF